MKKIFIATVLFALLISSLCFLSCSDDEDDSLPVDPTLDIETLRNLYTGEDFVLNTSNTEGKTNFSGVVISDAAAKNIEEGNIVVQDNNAGIIIDLGTSSSFAVGDSVIVDFSEGTLGTRNGGLKISNITATSVTVVAQGVTPKVTTVTTEELFSNFSEYESRLVKLENIQIQPAPSSSEKYSGEKDLDDGSTTEGTIILHVQSDAEFADDPANYVADYVGIAMLYNDSGDPADGAQKQLWPRNASDITKIDVTAYGADIIISGIMYDTSKADGPYNGQVSKAGDYSVVHDGGYEYVQFMALKDIDFSATPYSVVCIVSKVATANGWAEGNSVTFKFDLTSGTATKGSFFYIGGPSKRINGYYTQEGIKSTDISDANWIRTIDYNVNDQTLVTGDGFGNSNTGVLYNSQEGSLGPGGVAIFEGTTVTSESVPVDAAFYGLLIGTAYSESEGTGYKVPKNDLYDPVNAETGEPQTLFGQGTNTFLFDPVPVQDTGYFLALGGVLNSMGIVVPRTASYPLLTMTSVLSEIEDFSGVMILED